MSCDQTPYEADPRYLPATDNNTNAGEHTDSQDQLVMEGAAHRELAMTMPRKRVVLDIDPTTDRIQGLIVLRNKSSERIAFKNETSLEEGYEISPVGGVLSPDEQVQVTITFREDFQADRDVEQDRCTLLVVPYDDELYSSQQEFFSANPSAFDTAEKHMMMTAISPVAKKRLEDLCAEKEAKKKHEEEIKTYKRIFYPAIGFLLAAVCLYLTIADFCQSTVSSAGADNGAADPGAAGEH